MSADPVAILRIELNDIEPLIWRRVAVPTATNLQTLHRIIQAAMGWQDYHLWEFAADEEIYGIPEPDDAMWDRKVRRASATKIASLIERGVTAFEYTYDMGGDNWEHRIVVERVEAAEPASSIPSSAAANGAAHPRTAAASRVIMSSSTSSPAPTKARAAARKRKCSPGTVALTIPTTLTKRKSAAPSSASPPAANHQNPSTALIS